MSSAPDQVQPGRCVDGRLTVTDYGNNREMSAQQVVHSLSHSLVIVGHQGSRANFHNRLFYKIVNTKTILNELDAL